MSASALTVRPPSGPLILLLEDNDLVRRLTARMLAAAGYRTREAATAEEALAGLEGASLLVSDLTIAGEMIGAELAQRIRADRADLKVVLTTGHAPETLRVEGVDITGFPVLYKPYSKQELLAAVAAALAAPSVAMPAAALAEWLA